MQQEYKEAMEKISLSDSDKKRILANVKKACEESEEKVISMDEFKKRPRFSARQKGMAALSSPRPQKGTGACRCGTCCCHYSCCIKRIFWRQIKETAKAG